MVLHIATPQSSSSRTFEIREALADTGLAGTLSVPDNSPHVYTDNTAVLSSGNTMEAAQSRAQTAADALTSWARRNKMLVARKKIQPLILLQNAKDLLCVH